MAFQAPCSIDLKMELGMASARLSLHESHNVRNNPTCAGKSSVLNAMRDFDFEWAGSSDFAPLPYDFEHAKPARQRDADSEKIPTTSASLLGEFSCPQPINQSSQTNTSLGSFSKSSTYFPLPLGIVASENTRTISPSQMSLDHRHFFDISYSSVSCESERRPGLTLQSSYSSMISPNDGSLPSRKHSIVSDKADSDSDTPSRFRVRKFQRPSVSEGSFLCLGFRDSAFSRKLVLE
ncbi:hypothetical protein K469DRAFT_718771 [Zopfia rhizophila CBS 207.26]|uniref:Uncharacterized protein n=1 Tax=Zopfia rhizophila CBS 207.26 TaxID=1314779 RepID=A0A6A6ENU0_9PEZI|nr:hypothetical protein K469DRAFT_718771 [Zopfia rhizophila CBS 207.26]